MPLPRIYFGFRAPAFGDTRLDALDVAARSWRVARGAGSTAGSCAMSARQDVALFTLGFIGGASICAGWATVRPGIEVEQVETAFLEELDRLTHEPVTPDEMARAHALIEADELGALQRVEERADRLSMYATLFDDPGLIDRMLPRYLAVTPATILEVSASVFVPDNRLVLTYLPNGPAADSEALSDEDTEDKKVAA